VSAPFERPYEVMGKNVSFERISEIRSEHFAEDIEITDAMSCWSEADVIAYFDSGGTTFPLKTGSPVAASSRVGSAGMDAGMGDDDCSSVGSSVLDGGTSSRSAIGQWNYLGRTGWRRRGNVDSTLAKPDWTQQMRQQSEKALECQNDGCAQLAQPDQAGGEREIERECCAEYAVDAENGANTELTHKPQCFDAEHGEITTESSEKHGLLASAETISRSAQLSKIEDGMRDYEGRHSTSPSTSADEGELEPHQIRSREPMQCWYKHTVGWLAQAFGMLMVLLGCVLVVFALVERIVSPDSNSSRTTLFISSLMSSLWTGLDSTKAPRLQFINGCNEEALWIAGFALAKPLFSPDVLLGPGASFDVPIPAEGLAATRFWAKWGCDETGQACAIGQSGGPGQSCDSLMGCAPPVDSKFEATFGCLLESKQCATNPSAPKEQLKAVDWWDVSQVDGWTLPYSVQLTGTCPGSPQKIDCSQLRLSSCPAHEYLGEQYGNNSLRVMSPHRTATNDSIVVGCYSPCGKLTYRQWGQGYPNSPDSPAARNFCCPTPPIDPDKCSTGAIRSSEYVSTVHQLCPDVYAYAYDDGVGLRQCPAGTLYKVTFFCPN